MDCSPLVVLIPFTPSLEVKVDLRSSSLPLRPALVQFNVDDYAVVFCFVVVLNTTDRLMQKREASVRINERRASGWSAVIT